MLFWGEGDKDLWHLKKSHLSWEASVSFGNFTTSLVILYLHMSATLEKIMLSLTVMGEDHLVCRRMSWLELTDSSVSWTVQPIEMSSL